MAANSDNKFNAKLKEYRKKLGLTQKQFADILNMTRSNYAHLESEGNPSLDALMKISSVLKVSIDELIGNSLVVDKKDDLLLSKGILKSPEVFDEEFERKLEVVLSPATKYQELDAVERQIIVNYRIMSDNNRTKLKKYILKLNQPKQNN